MYNITLYQKHINMENNYFGYKVIPQKEKLPFDRPIPKFNKVEIFRILSYYAERAGYKLELPTTIKMTK